MTHLDIPLYSCGIQKIAGVSSLIRYVLNKDTPQKAQKANI